MGAGSGTWAGSGTRAGIGTRDGSGSRAGCETMAGSGTRVGNGSRDGCGTRADSGTWAGSGTKVGSETWAGNEEAVEAPATCLLRKFQTDGKACRPGADHLVMGRDTTDSVIKIVSTSEEIMPCYIKLYIKIYSVRFRLSFQRMLSWTHFFIKCAI